MFCLLQALSTFLAGTIDVSVNLKLADSSRWAVKQIPQTFLSRPPQPCNTGGHAWPASVSVLGSELRLVITGTLPPMASPYLLASILVKNFFQCGDKVQ